MKTCMHVKANACAHWMLFGLVALVVLAPTALATACGHDTKQSATAASLPPLPAGERVPIYAVLDASGGAAGASARENAFSTIERTAWEHGAGLVLGTLDGSTGGLNIVFRTLAVTDGVNGTFRDWQKTAMSSSMLTAFRECDARQATQYVDLIAAMRELQAELRGLGNGHFQVLIINSGLLRRPIDIVAHPQFLTDPAKTAAALAAAGDLPDLRGWSVAILTPRGTSDERSLALAALWWAIVERAGGQMTGFQGAVLTWPLAALPKPPTPEVIEVPVPVGRITLRVPDSVLFDVDKAHIRADAEPVIAKLVDILLHRYPSAPATVTGYTDSTGTAAWNLRLSWARAQAVAAALRASGVSAQRLRVEGRGASDFVAPNATVAGRQQNRRVEIVIKVT